MAVGFFLLFYLYVWFRIEPALEYQHSSPVFQLTRPFLQPFLTYPGGLLDYAAAGLSQLNYYNWLGALVYTALAGLLWLATRVVLGSVAGVGSRAAAFGVPFLLLLLRERYECPALAMSLGLLAALAFSLGYFTIFKNSEPKASVPTSEPNAKPSLDSSAARSPSPQPSPQGRGRTTARADKRSAPGVQSQPVERSSLSPSGGEREGVRGNKTSNGPDAAEAQKSPPRLRNAGSIAALSLVACWTASWLLFYLAGAWPCVVLLLLIGLFEGLHQHRKWLGLACALPIPVAAWWLVRPYEFERTTLLNPWCKRTDDWVLGGALYLFVPLLCVLLALMRPTKPLAVPQGHRGSNKPILRRHWYAATGTRRALAGSLLVLGSGVVWFGLAVSRKQAAEMDYYTGRGDYEHVLAVARSLPRDPMDFSSEVRLHLALYHTGRLGQDLFAYRNQSQWEVLPGLGGGLASCRAQSRTLLELGLVSEAEHLAHEALENEGERPELLARLAKVNVLKNRPKAARVFLNVLGTMPFQGSWARSWLRNLAQDPRLLGDPELEAIRRLMPTNDLAHQAMPTEGLLVQLLRCNSSNQMAFEYMMAKFLMDSQLNKFVERLGQLDNFKYAGIPRHYEEAVLLYEQLSRKPADLHGRSLRPETIERFRRFMDAVNQRVMETDAGRQAMARDFGDTYWYYYFGRRAAAGQS